MLTPVPSGPPQLRLKSFAIENFRTFRGRVEIELERDVTVFHGDTGAGKSGALAALDLYFRALAALLTLPQSPGILFPWGKASALVALGDGSPLLSQRDRPIATAPTRLAARFADDPSAWVEVCISPLGQNASVSWNRSNDPNFPRALLLQRLFPFGPTSRPLAILDARRRARWAVDAGGTSLLAPLLARALYALRTSRDVTDRERFRSFANTVASFPSLRGATVEVEAPKDRGDGPPELVIEHQGRAVLAFDELSFGEQTLIALTAGLLLSKAAILAIEDPEIGIDAEAQGLWKQVCDAQRVAGLVHQVIYESHALTFDGPRVVRFRRDETGATRVDSRVTQPWPDVEDFEATMADKPG